MHEVWISVWTAEKELTIRLSLSKIQSNNCSSLRVISRLRARWIRGNRAFKLSTVIYSNIAPSTVTTQFLKRVIDLQSTRQIIQIQLQVTCTFSDVYTFTRARYLCPYLPRRGEAGRCNLSLPCQHCIFKLQISKLLVVKLQQIIHPAVARECAQHIKGVTSYI